MKQDFAVAMKSPNAHIYMEMLRENIMSELKLSESASVDEIDLMPLIEMNRGVDLGIKYDAESKYNLDHLNNEHAIGFQNLEERAANID